MNFIPNETATPIRYPSTANLMLDSIDRTSFYSSPWEFQITKTNSLMNGFFTRIGTTEVVLEWCEPNVISDNSANMFQFDVSGGAGIVLNQRAYLPQGFYTVADALDELVIQINDLSGDTGVTVAVSVSTGGIVTLNSTGGDIHIDITDLAIRLGLYSADPAVPYWQSSIVVRPCADLRRYRYLDFISSQLTYNQDLKDTSTNLIQRDVLCRWYMAWDTPPQYDSYGFPILMGYTKFVLRRLFNPPKQIKWSANQPVGNLAFEVYGNDNNLVTNISGESEWLMTLQVSEV